MQSATGVFLLKEPEQPHEIKPAHFTGKPVRLAFLLLMPEQTKQ